MIQGRVTGAAALLLTGGIGGCDEHNLPQDETPVTLAASDHASEETDQELDGAEESSGGNNDTIPFEVDPTLVRFKYGSEPVSEDNFRAISFYTSSHCNGVPYTVELPKSIGNNWHVNGDLPSELRKKTYSLNVMPNCEGKVYMSTSQNGSQLEWTSDDSSVNCVSFNSTSGNGVSSYAFGCEGTEDVAAAFYKGPDQTDEYLYAWYGTGNLEYLPDEYRSSVSSVMVNQAPFYYDIAVRLSESNGDLLTTVFDTGNVSREVEQKIDVFTIMTTSADSCDSPNGCSFDGQCRDSWFDTDTGEECGDSGGESWCTAAGKCINPYSGRGISR